MLEVEGVSVHYGPFLALDDVHVRVGEGEIVGIVGPNGAGKSSLVKVIGGLVTPSTGRVRFKSQALEHPTHRRIDLGVSIVPEGRGLFARMTVDENLFMGAYSERDATLTKQRLAHCYLLFPILKARGNQLAGTLSGGQQQMLAVAMGLMSDPSLIVLDEPSLGLAPIVIQEIGRALARMKADGLTVLLVEQNARLTCSVADRIYIMQAGRIRYHDRPDKLFLDPEIVASYLGG
jgi:branched-chain amino acid transport system ATP-binding protein